MYLKACSTHDDFPEVNDSLKLLLVFDNKVYVEQLLIPDIRAIAREMDPTFLFWTHDENGWCFEDDGSFVMRVITEHGYEFNRALDILMPFRKYAKSLTLYNSHTREVVKEY